MKIKQFLFSLAFLFTLSITATSCSDPCEGVVCQNGGTCSEGDCICPADFTGNLCQTAIDPCDQIVCQNGGTCAAGICNCPPGFTGTYCDIADPCFGVSCQNGGTCSNGNCTCPAGVTGTYCETWWADSLDGIYVVVEQCPSIAPSQNSYSMVISKDPAQTDRIFLNRIYFLTNPSSSIYAIMNSQTAFTIPTQTVDNHTFNGSGTVFSPNLSLSFTVEVGGGLTETCSSNYIRQ